MHEAVRQRLSIQFPPSTAFTPCLVSLQKHVAFLIRQNSFTSFLVRKRTPSETWQAPHFLPPILGHDPHRAGPFRTHTGPWIYTDPP